MATIFNHLLLWNGNVNQSQILCGASLGGETWIHKHWIGHTTKIVSMPIYDEKPFNFFFSKTWSCITLKHSIDHLNSRATKLYIDDTGLFLTYFKVMSNLVKINLHLLSSPNIRLAFAEPFVLWLFHNSCACLLFFVNEVLNYAHKSLFRAHGLLFHALRILFFAQWLLSHVLEIFLCARIISFVLDNLLCTQIIILRAGIIIPCK